ncbi:hypothetical protein KAW18_02790 [candidate division WOR-3 bacterium]|nr:hypothetical protein [candidate division WOR-3 bacterium]
MTSNKIIQQTEEDYNAIPQIEVEGSFIKEIEVKKDLVFRGDLKGNPPIYRIKISIVDDVGGRHEVTRISGLCKDRLEVRI